MKLHGLQLLNRKIHESCVHMCRDIDIDTAKSTNSTDMTKPGGRGIGSLSSPVYQHFREEGGGKFMCLKCQRVIAKSENSTGNSMNHLARHHHDSDVYGRRTCAELVASGKISFATTQCKLFRELVESSRGPRLWMLQPFKLPSQLWE